MKRKSPLTDDALLERQESIQLAEAIKAHDERAFRRVWEKYQGWVYQVIYSILHNHEDTEEIWQDAFFKIWQKIDRFSPNHGSFQAWIGTVARNAAIDYLRRYNRRLEQVIPQKEEHSHVFIDCCPTAEEQLEVKELEQALEEELDHLANPKHRLVFLLRHKEGLSIKEANRGTGRLGEDLDLPCYQGTRTQTPTTRFFTDELIV